MRRQEGALCVGLKQKYNNNNNIDTRAGPAGFACAALDSWLLNFTFKRQNNSNLEIDPTCRPMMGQHSVEIDEESLQKTGRRRSSCLDVFLVTSIIILFLAVVAVAAVVGLFLMDHPSRSKEFRMPTSTTDAPKYKVRIGSHLEKNKQKNILTESFLVISRRCDPRFNSLCLRLVFVNRGRTSCIWMPNQVSRLEFSF